jgi:hypothetical protein
VIFGLIVMLYLMHIHDYVGVLTPYQSDACSNHVDGRGFNIFLSDI